MKVPVINNVQYLCHCLLYNLIFEGRNTDRPFLLAFLVYPDPLYRLCNILTSLQSLQEVVEVGYKILGVFHCRHPVDITTFASSDLAIGSFQQIKAYPMGERGKHQVRLSSSAHFDPLKGCLTYQGWRSIPSRMSSRPHIVRDCLLRNSLVVRGYGL